MSEPTTQEKGAIGRELDKNKAEYKTLLVHVELQKKNERLLHAIENAITVLNGLDFLIAGERTPADEIRWQLIKYLDKVYKDK